jgi:hypothetical protein
METLIGSHHNNSQNRIAQNQRQTDYCKSPSIIVKTNHNKDQLSNIGSFAGFRVLGTCSSQSNRIRVFAMFETQDHPALLTPWSLVHFTFGMLYVCVVRLAFPHISAVVALFSFTLVHLLYEFKDAYITYACGSGTNSAFNSLADHGFASAGAAMCYAYAPRFAIFLLAYLLFMCIFWIDALRNKRKLG